MYGKTAIDFPQRIVCLTAETAEIAFLVGAGDRVVGVPGTARRPEAVRERARVGGFTTFRIDRILALEPDLVLAFSDLQREIVARADRRRRGGALHEPAVLRRRPARDPPDRRGARLRADARALAGAGHAATRSGRSGSTRAAGPIGRASTSRSGWTRSIAGIRWVSELIEIAGGQRRLRRVARASRQRPGARRLARARSSERDPQIILASWCGKPVDRGRDRGASGLGRRSPPSPRGQIHEIAGEDVLVAGPVAHARTAAHSRDNSGVSIRSDPLRRRAPSTMRQTDPKSLGRRQAPR